MAKNSAQELEAMVIRLLGDSTDFESIMANAEKEIDKVTQDIMRAGREAARAQNEMLAEAARITEAVATPTERYSKRLADLDQHLEAGTISLETYERAVRSMMETLPAAAEKQERLAAAQKEAMEVLRQIDAEMEEGARVTAALATPLEKYNKEIERMDKLLGRGAISQETYERALKKLATTLPIVTAELVSMEREEREAKAAQDQFNKELDEAVRWFGQTRTAAERYEQQIAELNRMLKAGLITQDTYNRGMKLTNKEFDTSSQKLADFQNKLSGVGSTLTSMGQGITMLGAGMTAGITVPVTAFGYASVRAAGDFNSAMAVVRSATDPTAEELTRIRNEALGVSESLKIRPKGAVEGMTELLKAGISLEKVLGETGREALMFARVGELETATAATIMADSMTVFNESAKNTGNILSAAADSSSTGIRQIAEAFAQTSAVAGSSNQTLRDTAAAIALLANNGIKGSDAGTSLKTMFQRLKTPADKGAEAIKTYNLELRQADGQMRPFVELVGELQRKLGGLDQESRDNALFDIFGQDAIRSAEIFTKTGVDGFNNMTKAMTETLSVSEKFAILNATFYSTWEGFLAALDRLWIEVGDDIIGILTTALGWMTRVIDGITRWVALNPEMAQFAYILAAAAAALGPIVVFVGGLITGFGMLVGMVAGFILVGWEVVAISAAIVAGFVSLILQVAAVSLAIAGLVYYLVGPEGLSYAWAYVTETAKMFFTNVIGFLANFKHNMKVLLEWLPNNWHIVIMDLQNLFASFIRAGINNTMVGLRTMFRLWAAWQGWITGMLRGIFTIDFVNFVISGIKKVVSIFGNFAYQAWETLKSIFTGKKVDMSDFLAQLDKDFAKGMESGNFLGTAKDILQDEFKNLESPFASFTSTALTDGPAFLYDMGKEAGEALNNGVKDGMGGSGPNPWEEATKNSMPADFIPPVNHAADAIKKLTDEEEDAAKAIKKTLDALKEEQATFGMSEAQKKVWRLTQQGATADQIKEANAIASKIDAQNKEKKHLEEAARIMKKYEQEAKKHKSPLEAFKQTTNELQNLFDKGLISVDAFKSEYEDARKELMKETKVTFKVGGLEAIRAGTAEASAQLESFRTLANNPILKGIPLTPNTKRFGEGAFTAVSPIQANPVSSPEQKGGMQDTKRVEDYLKQIAENTKTESTDQVIYEALALT